MAGEGSKKSGENGERIARNLLALLGWKSISTNFDIACSRVDHKGDGGGDRRTHGEDIVFVYNSPFHDDRTEVVHVSVKNRKGDLPKQDALRSDFRAHVKDLCETMQCAKRDPQIQNMLTSLSNIKKDVRHKGVLIWTHNDGQNIERDIKPELTSAQLGLNFSEPIFLIDNSRASFLIKCINNANKYDPQYKILYPRIGTARSVDEQRISRIVLPEIFASDIVLMVAAPNGETELLLFANERFGPDSYRRLLGYGLGFAAGLVHKIRIGMPNYNEAEHRLEAERARMAFGNRTEQVTPFSFDISLLDLIQEPQS